LENFAPSLIVKVIVLSENSHDSAIAGSISLAEPGLNLTSVSYTLATAQLPSNS